MHTNIFRILLLLFSIQILASCASGTALVTGATRSPIEPEKVKLYLKEPTKYEVIAIVNASSDAGWTAQGSQDYAVKELKNQAAKHGANGVLLGTTGEKTTTVIGSGYNYGAGANYTYAIPVEAQTVSGYAIYVFEE